MFGLFKKAEASKPKANPRPQVRIIRAKYDSAATTDENRRHWANADGLSADAANNPEVRRILRNRSRYEIANNSYAKGIVLTLANDTIGIGPRLQMLTNDADTNRLIEREFIRWANAVCLPEKLRTMRVARAEDGETFGIMANNPLLASVIKLDIRLVEADQVATPLWTFRQSQIENAIDGIVFDEFGNPKEYHVLRVHPGSAMTPYSIEFDAVPAEWMIHWFRTDRPGQHRGVPDITPALPLFAQLRRFTLAVLGAAETAADFAGVLYTDAPPNGEAESIEPMDSIQLEKRMMLTLPGGWKMGQVQAEQPATTYAEFKREILNEIARCLNMPYNIAACNSSDYNYASGRLDHQTYYKSIRVDQDHIETVILDRILDAWLREAKMAFGLDAEDFPHQWFWDGHEHVDPAKEAKAQATRLESNTTTLAIEYAKIGLDWEEQLRQRAKEVSLMNQLGLTQRQALPEPQKHKEDDDADPDAEE